MQVFRSCRIPIANVLIKEIQEELYGHVEGPWPRIVIQSKPAKDYLNMELFNNNFSWDVSSHMQGTRVLFS